MTPPASTKPACTRDDALAVLTRLRDAGHEALFAGGCVRDLLLGLEPKDYDVATDAPPARVRELFSNTQAVGAAFGVILVRRRRSVVEVATFRADADYADGRHPSAVRFTNAEEDARRRDFTINGLFLDPLRGQDVERQVIDYVGGRADLRDRLIRAIGDPDARFNEDHLRMLRAVRFAARFDFAVEEKTADAIRRHAAQLIRISPERIAEELRMMLTPPMRKRAYALLEQLGLRARVFRFLQIGAKSSIHDRTASVFDQLDGDTIPFGLALAAAAIDHHLWHGALSAGAVQLFEKESAQKVARALRQSLKLSNEDSDMVRGTLAALGPLLAIAEPGVATLKRFLALPVADCSRRLLAASAQTGLVDRQRAAWLQQRLAELEQTEFAPSPLITGDDLSAAGLSPGPRFKHILHSVYDAQLEMRVTSRDEAMKLALSMA